MERICRENDAIRIYSCNCCPLKELPELLCISLYQLLAKVYHGFFIPSNPDEAEESVIRVLDLDVQLLGSYRSHIPICDICRQLRPRGRHREYMTKTFQSLRLGHATTCLFLDRGGPCDMVEKILECFYQNKKGQLLDCVLNLIL